MKWKLQEIVNPTEHRQVWEALSHIRSKAGPLTSPPPTEVKEILPVVGIYHLLYNEHQ